MKKSPFTEVICIDEFYWNRKSKNKYACAILDFSTGNIIDIIEGRKLKNWDSYTQLIKKDEFKKSIFLTPYCVVTLFILSKISIFFSKTKE